MDGGDRGTLTLERLGPLPSWPTDGTVLGWTPLPTPLSGVEAVTRPVRLRLHGGELGDALALIPRWVVLVLTRCSSDQQLGVGVAVDDEADAPW